MNSFQALLLFSALCGYCMAGSIYQMHTSPSELVTMAINKTPKIFFRGDKIIDKGLFYNVNGLGDCLGWCSKVASCQSVNLGESKKGEWYCELTGYKPSDTDYTAEPQEEEGFDNYSLVMQRSVE